MDEPLEYLAANLRKFREQRGFTQEDLSRKCGFSRTYVGKIERGNVSPSFHTLCRIANSLDVSLIDLLVSPDYKKGQMFYRKILSVSQCPAALVTYHGKFIVASEGFKSYFNLNDQTLSDLSLDEVVSSSSLYYQGKEFRAHFKELVSGDASNQLLEVSGNSESLYLSCTQLEITDEDLFLFEVLSERIVEKSQGKTAQVE